LTWEWGKFGLVRKRLVLINFWADRPLEMPSNDAHAVNQSQLYQVQVPLGLQEGDTFEANVGGQIMSVKVPKGLAGGSMIQASVPVRNKQESPTQAVEMSKNPVSTHLDEIALEDVESKLALKPTDPALVADLEKYAAKVRCNPGRRLLPVCDRCRLTKACPLAPKMAWSNHRHHRMRPSTNVNLPVKQPPSRTCWLGRCSSAAT
jgi:hypothetical protein